MPKVKTKIFVLRDPETCNYLQSFKIDARIAAPGMRGIYHVVYTVQKKDAMQIIGSAEFARGYTHSINFIFGTNYQPVPLV